MRPCDTRSESEADASLPEDVFLAAVSRGVFSLSGNGRGQGAVVKVSGQFADVSSPAKEVIETVTATIGGITAPVSFAGLAPTFVGLYQINVTVPQGITPGNAVDLVIYQAGVPSNTVTIAIQ